MPQWVQYSRADLAGTYMTNNQGRCKRPSPTPTPHPHSTRSRDIWASSRHHAIFKSPHQIGNNSSHSRSKSVQFLNSRTPLLNSPLLLHFVLTLSSRTPLFLLSYHLTSPMTPTFTHFFTILDYPLFPVLPYPRAHKTSPAVYGPVPTLSST